MILTLLATLLMLGLSKLRRDTDLLTGGVRLGGGNIGRGGVTCSSAVFRSFDRDSSANVCSSDRDSFTIFVEGEIYDVLVLFGVESCEVRCLFESGAVLSSISPAVLLNDFCSAGIIFPLNFSWFLARTFLRRFL